MISNQLTIHFHVIPKTHYFAGLFHHLSKHPFRPFDLAYKTLALIKLHHWWCESIFALHLLVITSFSGNGPFAVKDCTNNLVHLKRSKWSGVHVYDVVWTARSRRVLDKIMLQIR